MRKVLFTFICLFMFISVQALNLDLSSKYVYVHNITEDKTMYELSSDEEVKVASMTKIMTAIIIIENNKDLDKKIKIEEIDLRDIYEYTTTGFKRGDEVSIRELLYGILLKSGADAVNAGVRVTTDSEDDFVNLMNEKVKELGLIHTHFSNPVGKDEGNYSSVHDIGKIMEYCLKNKTFKEIISTNMYYIDRLDLQINGPLYKMDNKYGIDFSNIKGSKSGYTTLAKFSLVSYGEKDGVTYVVVTDYSDNYKDLLLDNIKIYDYFFNNYSYIKYKINFDIDIENGKNKKYNVNINTKLYLQNDYDKSLITYKYEGKDKITKEDKNNSKIGKIYIYYDNELLKELDVKIDKNIEYKKRTLIWIIIIIVLLIVVPKLYNIYKRHKKKIKIKNNQDKVKEFINKENSREKKLEILESTTDINLFFDTINNVDNVDKKQLEKDLIDRCFEEIDFTKEENLKDLYIKLNLYKNEMSDETKKYSSKLFKYCLENYINKSKKG